MTNTTRCGMVAFVGRPNVGKSTLLNRLVGQKVSITSAKPQTTRHRILGMDTQGDTQLVFVDTPGLHLKASKALNRYMNKTAEMSAKDMDAVVMVCDALRWSEEDDWVLAKLQQQSAPIILAVNKIDKIKDKDALLPLLQRLGEKAQFHALMPVSAKTGLQVEDLRLTLQNLMPESPFYYDEDQVTDKSMRFMAAELVREKAFRLSGQELPYSVTVEIEQYEVTDKMVTISALILVDKEAHKRMIIGAKGAKLKQIGSAARGDLEKILEQKVFLRLWCKVKAGWADNERALQSLGYGMD